MTVVQGCSFCDRAAAIYTIHKAPDGEDLVWVAFWCVPCVEDRGFDLSQIPEQAGKQAVLSPRSLEQQEADLAFDGQQAVNEAHLILAEARMDGPKPINDSRAHGASQ